MKHTRVADLTVSEKRRLNVACHLQLDTDIVILDQVLEPVFEFYGCMARPRGLMATTLSLEHFIAVVLVHNTPRSSPNPLQTLVINDYRRLSTIEIMSWTR